MRNVALGFWLIQCAWAFGFPIAAAMKIHVAIGLLIAYLAGLELWLVHYHRDYQRDNQP
jgi:hypothetical protein